MKITEQKNFPSELLPANEETCYLASYDFGDSIRVYNIDKGDFTYEICIICNEKQPPIFGKNTLLELTEMEGISFFDIRKFAHGEPIMLKGNICMHLVDDCSFTFFNKNTK